MSSGPHSKVFLRRARPPPAAGAVADDAPEADASRRLADRAFAIFASLWAVAILFHQVAYPARHVGFFRYALTLAALWVLLRPSSVPRFVALAAAQIVLVLYYLPNFITNHSLFSFFVNLTVLSTFGYLVVRGKSLVVERGELLRTFAPAVRIELLILYFYAVLHKLNADFLNPATSCAMDHFTSLAGMYPFLPTSSWVSPLAIYGTLVIEAAIPLLLLFRRTRVAGVLLGLGFHYMLALNPQHRFYNFSAMVLAVYFLFLPFDYVGGLKPVLADWRAGRWLLAHAESGALRRNFNRVVLAVGMVLLALFAVGFRPGAYRWVSGGIIVMNRGLWMLYGLAVMLVFVLVVRRWDAVRAIRGLDSMVLRPRWLVIFPLLVLFNGMSPYLGLKTETSFVMFSNLATEGGRWNHLLISERFRLSRYQDDLVEIEESSIAYLQRVANDGHLLPYLELRRRMFERPSASVTYVRNGERRVVLQAGDDPELSQPLPLLVRKFYRFRSVDMTELGTRCSH